MYVKTKTLIAAKLNTNGADATKLANYKIVAYRERTPSSYPATDYKQENFKIDENQKDYPREFIINNNTGTALEYCVINSPEEDAIYDSYTDLASLLADDKLGFTYLPAGAYVIEKEVGFIHTLAVRAVAGSGATDLRVDFRNFKPFDRTSTVTKL